MKPLFSWLWDSLIASIPFKSALFLKDTAHEPRYEIHNPIMVPIQWGVEITTWRHGYSGYCFSLPDVFSSTCPSLVETQFASDTRSMLADNETVNTIISPSLRFSVLSWSGNSFFWHIANLGKGDSGLFEEKRERICNKIPGSRSL